MAWLEKLEVAFRHGDLFETGSDGIVVTVSTEISAYGRLSKALLKRLGDHIGARIDEFRAKLPLGRLSLGEAVSFPLEPEAGHGYLKALILVALWDREGGYSDNLVYTVYVNSLRQAFKLSLKSLSMPIIKASGIDLGKNIVRVFSELNDLKGSDTFSLRRVEFVSTSLSDVEFLRDDFGAAFAGQKS